MPQSYAAAGIEPPLEELLNDPITLLLMARDGIAVADVRRAVAAGRLCVAGRPDAPQRLRGAEPASKLPHGLGTDSPAG